MAEFIFDEYFHKLIVTLVNKKTQQRHRVEPVLEQILDYYKDNPERNKSILALMKALQSLVILRNLPIYSLPDFMIMAFYLGSAYKQLPWRSEFRQQVNSDYPPMDVISMIQEVTSEEYQQIYNAIQAYQLNVQAQQLKLSQEALNSAALASKQG